MAGVVAAAADGRDLPCRLAIAFAKTESEFDDAAAAVPVDSTVASVSRD